MVVQEVISSERTGNSVDEVPEIVKQKHKYSVKILKIIKEAQQQHGLRHSDYQRYRGYCTRRIRRLRKVLKVLQGDKRHYRVKNVTPEMVKDERFLYIPLMLAERAWSYAMQLRQESNTEARKKFHLISRLRKATKYALQLEHICQNIDCDARTKLEAQAYVAWMHGSLHFELQLWKPAMENLQKAQVVYEKLAAAVSVDDQTIYKQRVEELSPSLRYCAYNIGDKSAIDDLLKMRGTGQGDLMANLDSLIAQTQEQRAEVMGKVEWRDKQIPVRQERVRLFLLSERDLDKSLNQASDLAAKIALVEKLLMDCKDAVASVRDEIKADPKASSGGSVSSSQLLLSYLMYIRLTRTIQRNIFMVETAKASLGDKNEGEGKKVRPQDITRLYEIILQNYGELQQLSGLENDYSLQQQCEIMIKAYRAFRSFYIAQSLENLRHWHDAAALYQRADQYAGEALAEGSVNLIDNKLRLSLLDLRGDIESHKYSSHALSVLEEEVVEDDGPLLLGNRSVPYSKKPLSERLGEYREDPSLTSKNPNVFKLPPDMQPIPCKPLFFDLAFNFVEFPSLENKLEAQGGGKKAAGLTGFVKGLWGWGGASK